MNKKNIFTILFIFLFSFSFFNSVFSATIANISLLGVSGLSNKGVVLNANIESLNGLTEIQVWFEYGLYKTNLPYKSPILEKDAPDLVSYNVSGLFENTTYYYRYCQRNINGEICTNIDSFKTYLAPTSDVIGYSNIEYGIATIFGRVSNIGSDVYGQTSKYWFEYGIGSSYIDIKNTPLKEIKSADIINEQLEFLKEDKDYYFKICVKNNFGSHCSDSLNFKTPKNIPIIIGKNDPVIHSINPIQINANSVNISGNVNRLGAFSSLYYYFEYGNDNNLGSSINENKKINKPGKIEYIWKDLEFNKDYYYRLCVRSLTDYISCGDIKNFKLKDYKNEQLNVDKFDISELKDKSVLLSGIVNGFGGTDSVSSWFEINDGVTNKETAKIIMQNFGRIFNISVDGLIPGKKYIYKACINNSVNILCSDSYEFITLQNPIIEVNNILELSNGNANIVGNITSVGVYVDNKIYGWFEYGEQNDNKKLKQTSKIVLDSNEHSYQMNNVSFNKKYYYRFCVDAGLSVLCTNTKNFIPKNIIKEPKVSIVDMKKNGNGLDITLKPLTFGGEKGASIYIEYNSIKSSFWKTKIYNVSNNNNIIISIKNLKDNRKYYYRTCIKNSVYTKCGNLLEITLNNLSKGEYLLGLNDIDKTILFVDNNFSKEMSGKIISKSSDNGNLWYVNPKDLKRYYLGNENSFYNIFKILLEKTDDNNIKKFPIYLDINYGVDTDKDGISDILENKIGTNYKNKDTDGDKYNDFEEINSGYNPNKKNDKLKFDNLFINRNLGKFFVLKNGDIWYINRENMKRYYIGNESNKKEIYRVLKLIMNTIDDDKFYTLDYYEIKNKDLGVMDSDDDSISDYYEVNYYKTNPFNADSNNNGCLDIKEINKEC